MHNLINNANLLDQKVDDYKVTSTFETASGTTNVEIKKSGPATLNLIIIAVFGALALLVVFLIFGR